MKKISRYSIGQSMNNKAVTLFCNPFLKEFDMKRFLGTVLFLVCAVTPLSAQTLQFGAGWDDGYSIRMNAPQYSLQLTGKFTSVIPENDDLDTATNAEVTIYGVYPFLTADQSKLGVFGGFSLMPTNEKTIVGGRSHDKDLDFAFRFGIEPQTMISQHLGLTGKLGLQVTIDQGYDGLDDSGSTGVGAWGSVGVHWYF
jgi:hypothetical protein